MILSVMMVSCKIKKYKRGRKVNKPVDLYCLVALPLPAGFPGVSVFACICTGRAASLLTQGVLTELSQVFGVHETGTAQTKAARIIMGPC